MSGEKCPILGIWRHCFLGQYYISQHSPFQIYSVVMSKQVSKQLYFFCGEESYLTKEAVNTLKQEHSSLQHVQFSDQFQLTDLRDSVSMNSLFGGSQLLLIKNPWFLSKAPADRDIDMIKTIVSLLPHTDHIMVIYTLGVVDQRKKMASFLKKNSIFQQHSYFKEWEQDRVLAWISNAVKMRGKTIDKDALIALEQVGGTQLQRLSNELDMLCLYRSDRAHLTLDDVKAMSADISTNTFNLIESLKGGNTADIICCMTQLLRSGEDPIRLMGLIVSQIQLFVQLLQLHQRKVPSQDIAKSVGKNPYYIQKLLPALTKAYSLDTVSQLLINLATADYEIKSGKKKPEAALTLALLG